MGKRLAEEQTSTGQSSVRATGKGIPRETGTANSGRKSGRTVFDDTGQGIWEWQTATGVFERNVTEEQLRRLEAPDLALVDPMTPTEGRVWRAPVDLPKKQSHGTPSNRTLTRPARQGSALSRFLRRITGVN